MYTIMGVTGKVGGAAARDLLNHGSRLRVVVRDQVKGDAWAERGCEVAVADLHDSKALTTAFEGAEGVFVMLPPIFDPAPGFREAKAMIATLYEALQAGQPGKIVALSTIGAEAANPNLLNQLGLLERCLSGLSRPVTFLRAAWFMENAAGDVAAAKEKSVIDSYLQPVERPVSMVSAVDVGRAVSSLLREQWTGVRVEELEAHQRVSPKAIATAFSKSLGKSVSVEAVPRDQWESIFRAQGMTNPAPRIQMIDGFNQGWIDFQDQGSGSRKGDVTIDEAIAALVKEG
ncbi:NmrA family NAD(P)-binding protein [Bradyrhizobium sp. 187]|uniref:NmrA family NAD(P)-binding protein n=1 Tax=Bradyrhizobium sp. 187 TaxID=2782655 RepID=UPI001FFF1FB5|nr:NmrA family NAD(P)-binding protein [Bradyrhizobium sp. 187]UPJ71849.1 NmrA family NAD(P)-binding protein [Bradyrhizobium sp. 187]